MPSKEELFREVYGNLSDEEIEAYGGMIFRQLQEQEINSKKDDQKRVATPRQAILDGADYVVVGRPIINAEDPKKAAEDIIKEIDEALKEKENRQVGEDTKREKSE